MSIFLSRQFLKIFVVVCDLHLVYKDALFRGKQNEYCRYAIPLRQLIDILYGPLSVPEFQL